MGRDEALCMFLCEVLCTHAKYVPSPLVLFHVGVHILPCVFLCVCPCAPARYRGKGTFVGAVSLQRLRNKEVVSLHLFLFSELTVRHQPSVRGHTNSGIHFLYGCVRVIHTGIYTETRASARIHTSIHSSTPRTSTYVGTAKLNVQ